MSTFDKAKQFASAAIDHALGGFQQASTGEYNKRLTKCQQCDRRSTGWTCEECGCHILLKAKWAEQDCPLGKWSAEEGSAKPPEKKRGCGGCNSR